MPATENLEGLKQFMVEACQEVEELKIHKRDVARYPFDFLADEILSKAFALARCVIVLIEHEQPEEALGLGRSLVECALNLRWITFDRSQIQARSMLFVKYGMTVKGFWYWWAKKRYAGTSEADDADRYAAEWNIAADEKGVFRHWSGENQFTRISSELTHPLSASYSNREDYAVRRAHDYFQPSLFVHCSQPGVDSYFSDDPLFKVHRHKADPRDFARDAILICNSYLHDIVTYCLYGMNVFMKAPLDCLGRHIFDGSISEYRLIQKQK